jgi:protoporphyrin/coproporphyrin ferrochelatase
MTIGVLLMAYGGPDNLDEVAGYLADIRSGRPTTNAVLKEIRHNYEQIGGKSPLFAQCQKQAAALQSRLSDEGDYRVYLGMRHWSPWIEEVVGKMGDDGIKQAVAIVLAPHYSSYSIEKYHDKVRAGLKMYAAGIDFAFVKSYNTAPPLIEAFANRVREGLARFDPSDRVHVVLSAHSLPVRIINTGDPYQDELFESARLIADAAGLSEEQWSWSYQSAGRSPEPWLGPQIEVYVKTLADKGVKNVVSVPIGFVSDHVEMLYDIDIKAQNVAKENGVKLVRPPALNDDPLYIETLATQVLQAKR